MSGPDTATRHRQHPCTHRRPPVRARPAAGSGPRARGSLRSRLRRSSYRHSPAKRVSQNRRAASRAAALALASEHKSHRSKSTCQGEHDDTGLTGHRRRPRLPPHTGRALVGAGLVPGSVEVRCGDAPCISRCLQLGSRPRIS
ncbi:hypothetical protein Ae331Ps2_6370 [Pseudonocardia sp. Ae331_Ps2]|nr:hypothetical protein Ae331Ps2_6370 [Pseudonocardia sp. Ae331_Ps2]